MVIPGTYIAFLFRKLKARLTWQYCESWYNHRKPDINKGVWIKEEDEIIMDALSKWAGIANIISNFVGTAHSKIDT